MENNWFKKADDLEESKGNTVGSSYFTKAGDLPETVPSNNASSYFTKAGDLEEARKENNSFKFEESSNKLQTPDEIRDWLKTIVSGKKKANYAFGEGLPIASAGQKFVTVEELQNMYNAGDNIISAEYLENMNMVLIEFESFRVTNKSR